VKVLVVVEVAVGMIAKAAGLLSQRAQKDNRSPNMVALS
jgi:hypothetical protein